MTDREKVVKKLEECLSASCRGFRTCPYSDADWDAVKEALALLREQEPDETRFVHRYSRPGVYVDLLLHCEKCDGTIEKYATPKYCPWCGRKVQFGGETD